MLSPSDTLWPGLTNTLTTLPASGAATGSPPVAGTLEFVEST